MRVASPVCSIARSKPPFLQKDLLVIGGCQTTTFTPTRHVQFGGAEIKNPSGDNLPRHKKHDAETYHLWVFSRINFCHQCLTVAAQISTLKSPLCVEVCDFSLFVPPAPARDCFSDAMRAYLIETDRVAGALERIDGSNRSSNLTEQTLSCGWRGHA
jgi:hypothetical protein